MRRRELIMLLGGTLAAWPLTARAQPAKLPTVGFLGPLSRSAQSEWTAAFLQRMREHDWIEGRTLAIEYRWAEGRSERFAEIAAEFIQLNVDVIVTAATAAVIALKQATSVIPIVFAAAGDPVGTGLVASLARPGGNVTGLSNQSADIASKRLVLLREAVPNLHRLAIMATGGPIGVLEMGEVQAAARTLGLEVIPAEIRRAEDIAPAIEALKGRAEALYVVTEPLVNTKGFDSTPWRWARDCRRCMALGTTSKRAVSWPMEQTFRSYGVEQQITSTKFCGGRRWPTSRLSSLPSLTFL
jgi:putative ABC transport system substrate-binding protein